MNLSNIEIDLMQDALMRYVTDRYIIPTTRNEWKTKSDLIMQLYDRLEAMRQHPVATNNQDNPF